MVISSYFNNSMLESRANRELCRNGNWLSQKSDTAVKPPGGLEQDFKHSNLNDLFAADH